MPPPGSVATLALAVVLATAASAAASPVSEQGVASSSSEPRVAEVGPEPGVGARPRRDRVVEAEEKPIIPSSTIFWIDSGLGWERVGLTTLRVRRDIGGDVLTGDLVPSVLSGPMVQLGFGLRWLVLSFGARIGASFFDDSSPDRTDGTSQFYNVDAELGFRIPAGRLEPHIVLGAGYSRFGGLDDAIRGVGQGLDIDGANLRLGLGLDYFVTRNWSIGARVAGEVLFLSRSGVPLRDLASPQQVSTIGEAKSRLLEGEGSSAGTSFALTIGPGVHF